MRIEESVISKVPVFILYFDNLEEGIPLMKEIRDASCAMEASIYQISSRKLVFGVDIFQKLSIDKPEQFSSLRNSYYYGQIGPGKGIVFAKL